jgi:hypothetical protein
MLHTYIQPMAAITAYELREAVKLANDTKANYWITHNIEKIKKDVVEAAFRGDSKITVTVPIYVPANVFSNYFKDCAITGYKCQLSYFDFINKPEVLYVTISWDFQAKEILPSDLFSRDYLKAN